jgi:LysM repeat protein
VHRVKKGETAYSICRAYGIGEAELKRDNPSVAKIYPNLQSDMWLKILITEATENPQKIEAEPAKTPATANVSRHQKSSTAADGVTLLEHKVRRKETLFSISNMYEVDIDFIKQYNPQIFAEGKGVIKARQVLQIPISLSGLKKGSAIKLSEQSARCDSGARSMSSLNVALLLPFNAEMQDDVEQLDRSFRFLEVYEGAMLALENLRQQGLSVNLSVFDTKSATTEMLLRNASLAKADLIIGPVYQEMLKPIAEFARQRNIKIVSPLLSVDSALYGNNNVFQIPVDFDKQMQQLLVHDGLNVKANNVILVSQRDEEASRNLRNDLRQYLPKTDSVIFRNMAVNKDSSAMEELRLLYETQLHRPTVKILQYKIGLQPRENQEVFLRIFNPEIENKVVVASQDEPFVSELLLNLKAFSDRYKCRITVYGTSSWQKFDNIERKLFYDLKLHVAAPYYIKYYSENVKQFVHSFREKYKTEPSQFAFQGYDVMLYFASAMHRYGKDFEGCLPYHKVPLLQSNYSFAPICADGAYENVGVFLLRYTPWLEIIQYE